MTEHEVPTHVQAEDRVILWFTFPQIVAMTAVCALGYGVYRYAPVGSGGVRMGLAIVFALVGVAIVAVKVGGRSLPAIGADLLRFGLGPRLFAGSPAELVRSSPPRPLAAVQRRTERRRGPDRRGRRTFRPHRWFGKRRARSEDRCAARSMRAGTGGVRLMAAVGVAAMAAALAAALMPGPVSAEEPVEYGLWDIESEIEFEPSEPVPGRRLYVEELTVSGDRAAVTVRAATDVEVRARAFGGIGGRELRYWSAAGLAGGETASFSLPLAGDQPSFTFSWKDGIGQGGALVVRTAQIPYPLPEAEGPVCEVSVTSLGWKPGEVSGVLAADCGSRVDEVVRVWTAVGHELIGVDAVIDSEVTAVSGTVAVTDGGYTRTVAFAEGDIAFTLPVAVGQSVRPVTIDLSLTAALSVPMPDMARLTHHPARTETVTTSVSIWRPGTGQTVSRTVSVSHGGGIVTNHTISAHLSVPGAFVTRSVSVSVDHIEHVRAVVETRPPIDRDRAETLALAADIGADAAYAPMVYPGPKTDPHAAVQRVVTREQIKRLLEGP